MWEIVTLGQSEMKMPRLKWQQWQWRVVHEDDGGNDDRNDVQGQRHTLAWEQGRWCGEYEMVIGERRNHQLGLEELTLSMSCVCLTSWICPNLLFDIFLPPGLRDQPTATPTCTWSSRSAGRATWTRGRTSANCAKRLLNCSKISTGKSTMIMMVVICTEAACSDYFVPMKCFPLEVRTLW